MYYTKKQLLNFGFDKVGEGVKISSKVSLYDVRGSIGHDTRIDDYTILKGSFDIGNKVHICSHSSLSAVGGTIRIGALSGIGVNSIFYTVSDDLLKSALCGPLVDQRHAATKAGSINIGQGVALGGRATVFPGVTIGDFAAVGVGSIITNDLESAYLYTTAKGRVRRVSRRDYSALKRLADVELGQYGTIHNDG